MGEEDMDLDGGRELRSGGAIVREEGETENEGDEDISS